MISRWRNESHILCPTRCPREQSRHVAWPFACYISLLSSRRFLDIQVILITHKKCKKIKSTQCLLQTEIHWLGHFVFLLWIIHYFNSLTIDPCHLCFKAVVGMLFLSFLFPLDVIFDIIGKFDYLFLLQSLWTMSCGCRCPMYLNSQGHCMCVRQEKSMDRSEIRTRYTRALSRRRYPDSIVHLKLGLLTQFSASYDEKNTSKIDLFN